MTAVDAALVSITTHLNLIHSFISSLSVTITPEISGWILSLLIPAVAMGADIGMLLQGV